MDIEGTPQKKVKSARAEPIMKEAVVRTTVRLKSGDWKADGVDLIGQAPSTARVQGTSRSTASG